MEYLDIPYSMAYNVFWQVRQSTLSCIFSSFVPWYNFWKLLFGLEVMILISDGEELIHGHHHASWKHYVSREGIQPVNENVRKFNDLSTRTYSWWSKFSINKMKWDFFWKYSINLTGKMLSSVFHSIPLLAIVFLSFPFYFHSSITV